jgi:DNA-directed RNA polymerase II subunit RPB2
VCADPDNLMKKLLKAKRYGRDSTEQGQAATKIKELSIVRDIFNKEIRIYTDHGRVQRPVFVVEKGQLNIKPQHIQLLKVRKMKNNSKILAR